MGQQEPYEVQQRETQSPAPEVKQPHAPVRTVWADWLESCFAEKALGVLVDTKFTMTQKHGLVAKTANSLQGCIRQSIASR